MTYAAGADAEGWHAQQSPCHAGGDDLRSKLLPQTWRSHPYRLRCIVI